MSVISYVRSAMGILGSNLLSYLTLPLYPEWVVFFFETEKKNVELQKRTLLHSRR